MRQGDAIAAALTIDTGGRALSRIEVDSTVSTLERWAARATGLIARTAGAPRPSATPSIEISIRLVPYPLAGAIGPWNFPLMLALTDAIPAQIDDAVANGAQLLAGGTVEDHGGLWLRPIVLTDVTPDMAVMRDETFGPVIPVTVFDSVDEAVSLDNAGALGLSAAMIGAEALEVAARLTPGAVSIDDGALTSMVWDAEKSSFGASGLGPSQMGDSGLTRFLRRQALLRQTGAPLPLAAFAEDARW